MVPTPAQAIIGAASGISGHVTDSEARTFPDALSAVRVPTLRGDDNEVEDGADVGPANATNPFTGAIESVAPPENPVSLTWATPGPVAAVTTRTGSPSATPTMAVSTALRAFE
jgi:hypothetical protein